MSGANIFRGSPAFGERQRQPRGYGGISVTLAARWRRSRVGSRVPRRGAPMDEPVCDLVSQPCGKSGNRNGRSEMAGLLAWPKMPRKIPSFWISGCGRSDTMDSKTAWQRLSKMVSDEESREPSQPGPFDFSKSFVSLRSSHVHNQRYRVSCLSHESCKAGRAFL
jgi:hypothetical protein